MDKPLSETLSETIAKKVERHIYGNGSIFWKALQSVIMPTLKQTEDRLDSLALFVDVAASLFQSLPDNLPEGWRAAAQAWNAMYFDFISHSIPPKKPGEPAFLWSDDQGIEHLIIRRSVSGDHWLFRRHPDGEWVSIRSVRTTTADDIFSNQSDPEEKADG